MLKKILWIGLALIFASSLELKAQYDETESTYKRARLPKQKTSTIQTAHITNGMLEALCIYWVILIM